MGRLNHFLVLWNNLHENALSFVRKLPRKYIRLLHWEQALLQCKIFNEKELMIKILTKTSWFKKKVCLLIDLAQLLIYNTNTCYLKVTMLIFC